MQFEISLCCFPLFPLITKLQIHSNVEIFESTETYMNHEETLFTSDTFFLRVSLSTSLLTYLNSLEITIYLYHLTPLDIL